MVIMHFVIVTFQLKDLQHDHINRFVGICTDHSCIITEYCPRGSLMVINADHFVKLLNVAMRCKKSFSDKFYSRNFFKARCALKYHIVYWHQLCCNVQEKIYVPFQFASYQAANILYNYFDANRRVFWIDCCLFPLGCSWERQPQTRRYVQVISHSRYSQCKWIVTFLTTASMNIAMHDDETYRELSRS